MELSSIPSLARKNNVENDFAICHETITLFFEYLIHCGKSALELKVLN